MRYLACVLVVVCLLAAASAVACAESIPGDLTLTGEIDFDAGSSFSDPGASSTGSFGLLVGGVPNESTYAGGSVVSGSDPVSATFTDVDDGFGIAGLAFGAATSEFLAGIDLEMALTNASPTDTYAVTLLLAFTNTATAVGTDAWLASELTLDDDVGEFFFTDIVSDTVFGNALGGIPTGDFGGLVTDAGSLSFTITLAPGGTAHVYGAWTMEGGAFVDATSQFQGTFGMNLTIDDVQNESGPPVPEPTTLALFGLGAMGLAAARRRRQGA